jgi:hypothetical protein
VAIAVSFWLLVWLTYNPAVRANFFGSALLAAQVLRNNLHGKQAVFQHWVLVLPSLLELDSLRCCPEAEANREERVFSQQLNYAD